MPPSLAPGTSFMPHATLSQQLGQMIISGFEGTQPTDAGVAALRERAERGEVGGVILFGYNIASPKQLHTLLSHIKSWAVPLPLLISVDQEGGAVQRLRPAEGFCGWPSAYDVSHTTAAQTAAPMDGLAQELQTYGFNVNLAPSVDLHDQASPIMGALGRNYGSDPQSVAHWAHKQIVALESHGVGAVIKHFPGHGSARGDTHRGLTDVTTHWQPSELAPFEALISAKAVRAVMTSHLVHRGLDPSGDPVTFSRPIVHELLRGRLGFEGLVISDDLGMGALVHDYGLPTIIARTVQSGHDVLIFGQNAAAAGRGAQGHQAIDNLLPLMTTTIQAAIDAGTVQPTALRQSFDRIAAYKQRFLATPSP